MRYRLYISCLLLCSCFGKAAFAQDMAGIWRGTLTQGVGGCYPVYYIELQLDAGISGTSYSYYDTSKFVKLAFSGQFDKRNKRVQITESRVLEYRIPPDCIPCIKKYDLSWHAENGKEVLSGEWSGKEMGGVLTCPPGKITLERVTSSPFAPPVAKANPVIETKKTLAAPALAERRRVDLVETILVDTVQLRIELYDSGQVDGDTISIFLNNELILSKKKLSEQPIVFDIPIQPSRDYEMIMYAENLGSIPPNTALMVVRTRKTKHEVYLSSSEQKSAGVKFRYER